MTPTVRAESPRTRGEATELVRRRLVEAAIFQLASEGISGLTHRRVEQRAGLSQGLTKYHFGSRDGLIEAVLAHLVDVELDTVMSVSPETQAAARAAGAVPPEVLDRAIATYARLVERSDLVRARFELYLYAADRPALQAIIGAGRQRFVERVARSLPCGDPEGAARLVLALVNGLLLHRMSAPDPRLDELAPLFLLAAGEAGMALFGPPPPPSG